MTRGRYQGIRHVFQFNWPYYAAAAGAFALASIVGSRSRALRPAAGAAATLATWWSVASVAASHWVHDRSPLYSVSLFAEDLPPVRRWALLHAGLDEFSDAIRAQLGDGDVIDFYDPAVMHEPSIARARRGSTAKRRPLRDLGLGVSQYDAIFVPLALHEIRSSAERARFLRHMRDALTESGRIILVDHMRDMANVLAFGPGALHFLPERDYRRAIDASGLAVARESTITPLVHAFVLKAGSR